MGYELNRIMKQYGVNTAGQVNYSGTAAPSVPTTPTGTRPTGEDAAAIAAQKTYDKQLADFNAYKADPAAFNETMRKYGLDQKSYDIYKTDYQNRLQNTPMYSDRQFQTADQPTAKTVADLYKMYLGREPEAGIVGTAAASTRPNFIQEAQRELSTKPNFGNQNLMNATGSYYGNQLTNPTYGAIPASMINAAPQEKSDYYLKQRNLGYTNADLRAASENTFGKVNEGDWAQLTARAYPTYNANIVDAYKSIGRTWEPGSVNGQIDPEGYNYWMNQVSSGAFDPKNLNSTFAKIVADKKAADDAKAAEAARVAEAARLASTTTTVNSDNPISPNDTSYLIAARGGSVHDLADKYAQGGQVKTHYQTAGEVRLPSGYGSLEEEEDFARRFRTQPEAVTSAVDMAVPPPPVIIEPSVVEPSKSALTEIATRNLKADPMPATEVAPIVVAVPKAALPGGERMATMQAMLAAYGPKDGAYDKELKTARDRATADSDAFTKMLTDSMKSPEDAQSSKAEMYFRLAAAFGAPTKTGQFSENLGMVGKELGEYAKGKRASAREKQLLGLEVQKLKMASSKEDLNTLRALAGKEMDDKRAIATELIKDYIKSGEPQSTAGKQALDEGFKTGTKEYQDRVAAIGNMNVEAKMAQINSALASMTTQAAMLALAQNKFENVKDQQSRLTGPEVELKIKTEDMLGSTTQAMNDLKRAYSLNDNTFDTSAVDAAQRKLLETAGSKDPKLLNTREQENLLQKGALAQLKSTFPGAISDAETKTLQALQGLGSKSKEERALIMKNAFRSLKAIEDRSKLRLGEINRGSFRETVPTPQGLE